MPIPTDDLDDASRSIYGAALAVLEHFDRAEGDTPGDAETLDALHGYRAELDALLLRMQATLPAPRVWTQISPGVIVLRPAVQEMRA